MKLPLTSLICVFQFKSIHSHSTAEIAATLGLTLTGEQMQLHCSLGLIFQAWKNGAFKVVKLFFFLFNSFKTFQAGFVGFHKTFYIRLYSIIIIIIII